MQDFNTSLPMLLYRALHEVMPRFRAIFAEFDLTEPQWRVLRVLWERDEINHTELAACTLIPAPSLVGVLDRLEANGLVTRRRRSSDRRSVMVTASAAGAALEPQVMPAVEAAYEALRNGLDEDTWTALVDGLTAIAAAQSAAPPATMTS